MYTIYYPLSMSCFLNIMFVCLHRSFQAITTDGRTVCLHPASTTKETSPDRQLQPPPEKQPSVAVSDVYIQGRKTPSRATETLLPPITRGLRIYYTNGGLKSGSHFETSLWLKLPQWTYTGISSFTTGMLARRILGFTVLCSNQHPFSSFFYL